MITGRQIRAARALLDWSAEVLAKKVGLSREAINKMEDGSVQPRAKNLADIMHILDEHGIEFTGERGVQFRDDTFKVYEGSDDFLHLLDEVYYSLKDRSERIVRMMYVDYAVNQPVTDDRFEFLTKQGFTFLSLIRDGGKKALGPCHAIATKDFNHNPKFIYADRAATVVDEPNGKKRILVIRNASLADMERRTFDLIWRMTKEVSDAV
jgi:DNA-binding XRE family transcriptional regulator